MSLSAEDRDLKLWDIYGLECIFNYNIVIIKVFCLLACILYENNINYIITSNFSNDCCPNNIKIYDLNNYNIKSIDNSNNNKVTIILFYDFRLNKNFIISGNFGYIKSYDFS